MSTSEDTLTPRPAAPDQAGDHGHDADAAAAVGHVLRLRGPLAALRFGASLAIDAVRDFVWADLKDGILDLRGLGSPLRALVWLGFALLLLVIVGILQGDWWRQTFSLVALTQGIPGRGRLVPAAVIPFTFFLLSLAWSFILAGALRARRSIKLGILALWALTMMGSMVSGGTGGLLSYAIGATTLLAVPIAFLVFSYLTPRRVLEVLVLLVLVTANNAVNQLQGVETWHISGMPLMVMRLSFEIAGLSMLIIPLLLLVGMDVATFTFKAAGWVTGIVEERVTHWAPSVLLAALLGWRLWQVLTEAAGWLEDGPFEAQAAALVGGLSVPILTGVGWLAVRALASPTDRLTDRETIDSTSKRLALPLVLSYTVTLLLVVVLSGVALVLTVGSLFVRSLLSTQEQMLGLISRVGGDDTQWVWHITVSILTLIVAAVLARRGQHVGALFLVILGLLDLRSRLSVEGQPLEFLNAAGPGNRVDIWWVLLFAGLALWWLMRRQLTPQRASALAFMTLVTLLLRQTDFISNRFSPFVDSSGLGFLAFGIVWDALTIGAWANIGTPGLPRVSRIFLYLGYVLLTVTVINWAVTSHDLESVGRLTGDLGLVGMDAFGKPMLYTIFVVTLIGAFRGLGVTALAEPPDAGQDAGDEATDAPTARLRRPSEDAGSVLPSTTASIES